MPENEEQSKGWKVHIDSVSYTPDGFKILLSNGYELERFSSVDLKGLNDCVTYLTLEFPLLRENIKQNDTISSP
jgi:hypothetical protein